MRKMCLLSAAVPLLFAACSRTTVEYEDASAIAFCPVVETPSVKAVTGPMSSGYDSGESFVVYAFHKVAGLSGGEAWTAFYGDGNSISKWIDGGTFANTGTANQWGGSPQAYYWPKTGYLMFAGYSPAGITGGNAEGEASAEAAGYTPSESPQFSLTGFRQGSWTSSNENKMVDLMWFNADDEGMTAVNNSATGASVPVKFHHALSWLTFRFYSDVENTFFLTQASLAGVKSKGNMTGKKSGAVWTEQSEPVTYTLHQNPGGTMLIPGEEVVADNILAVPYDFSSAVAGEYDLILKFKQGGNDQLEQTVTLNLKSQANKVWEAGKHYTYTVKLSAQPIILEPTVDQWSDIDGGGISPQ